MKVYSIGREIGCDIIINDNSDVISRRHATLNVTPSGKMTIVDLSHNGTYVNGIRIAQNVPVPVTRKDNVSFAHVARLDWNMVPNTSAIIVRWAVIVVIALLVVIGGVWGFSTLSDSGSSGSQEPAPVAVDSAELKKERQKAVTEAIRKLPDEARNIIILREFRGLSYEELADVLDLEPGTVKSRLNRAKQKLKEILLESLEQNSIWDV